MHRTATICCILALACLLIPSGAVRADLSTSEVYTGVAVSLHDVTPLRASLGKYQFDRRLRPDLTEQFTSSVTTSATPLVLAGDLDTTAAGVTPVATFNIGDGSLLDGGSVTNWPSGRYTESTQSWADAGGTVTGNISNVPLPASALLALIGLGIVGVGRTGFVRRG